MPRLQTTCRHCGHRSIATADEVLERLRGGGMLRRAKRPDWDLILELAQQAALNWKCRECGAAGLAPSEHELPQDEWERACEACGKTISAERLELFPNQTRCAACQQKHELGEDQWVEYCSRCGSIMTLKPRSGTGIARYELACGNCRS